MDKVIVTALLVIASVTAAGVVISAIIPTISTSSQAVIGSQRVASDRIKTSIEIIAVAPTITGDRIDAWVKNVGAGVIDAIEKTDVFVIKADGSRFDELTYKTDGTSKTFTGDLEESNLRWNRGDTLHLFIYLQDDLLSTGDHVLRVATHNGITDQEDFEKP